MERSSRVPTVISASLFGLVLIAIAFTVGAATAGSEPVPGPASVEAGFSRAMQVHHNQGVELAMIVRDASEDQEIRLMAYDMAVTQAQQSGQMYGWLAVWGVPQSSAADLMAWMGEHEHATADGTMPGLATAEQLAQLRAATGVEAERIFLELMIAHHQGAVAMAEAALELGVTDEVAVLAESIVESQTTEMAHMRELLAERS